MIVSDMPYLLLGRLTQADGNGICSRTARAWVGDGYRQSHASPVRSDEEPRQQNQLFDRPSPDAWIGERHLEFSGARPFQGQPFPCARAASGRQVYAASLYEWAAIIDPDSDASSA